MTEHQIATIAVIIMLIPTFICIYHRLLIAYDKRKKRKEWENRNL